MTKTDAERRLAQLLMDDIPVKSIIPRTVAVANDWFAKYKNLRREFMRSLSDSITELSFLNFSQEEFMNLITGRALPENCSLRLRVPLVFGGELEIDNMFLCRTFPFSQNMDRFILEQHGAGELWLPNPAKKVYVSTNILSGGDGGNATEDRLAQMSAQLAGRGGME